MPNHCTNSLQVWGTPYHIRNFARDHYRHPDTWGTHPDPRIGSHLKSTLDFSASVPLPEDKNQTTFHHAGYDWQCANWGTKWNAYDVTPDTFPDILKEVEDTDRLTFSFNTAWSPPAEWVVSASAKYPDLTFILKYREEGMAFCGWIVAQKGEHDENHLSDYPEILLTPDEMKLLDDEDSWDEAHDLLHERVEEYLDSIPYGDLTFSIPSL